MHALRGTPVVLFWLLLLQWPILSIGQSLTTYWIEPPPIAVANYYKDNQVLNLGSQLQLRWVTFEDNYSIWLWQQNLTAGAANLGNPIFTKNSAQNESGTSTWLVDGQGFNLGLSNVFFLALGPKPSLDGAVITHYLNITNIPGPSALTFPSTVVAATSQFTQVSNATSSSAIPPPTITAAMTKNDYVSDQASSGLGAGLGITVAALFILLILTWKFRKAIERWEKYSLVKKTMAKILRFLRANKKHSVKDIAVTVESNEEKENSKLRTMRAWQEPLELDGRPH